jgi:hypothetical protein
VALKPEEQLPIDKMRGESKKFWLISPQKKKKLTHLASANSEKERIQKEYDARIKEGNTTSSPPMNLRKQDLNSRQHWI